MDEKPTDDVSMIFGCRSIIAMCTSRLTASSSSCKTEIGKISINPSTGQQKPLHASKLQVMGLGTCSRHVSEELIVLRHHPEHIQNTAPVIRAASQRIPPPHCRHTHVIYLILEQYLERLILVGQKVLSGINLRNVTLCQLPLRDIIHVAYRVVRCVLSEDRHPLVTFRRARCINGVHLQTTKQTDENAGGSESAAIPPHPPTSN
jgi:hypothetical protein